MKTKEEILEGYFGSDYWLLKERDDLQYILRAMDEYANQFKQLNKPVVMQGLLSKCPHCQGTGIDHEIPNYEAALNSSPAVASEGQEKSVSGGNLCLHQNVIFQDDKPLCVDCGNIP